MKKRGVPRNKNNPLPALISLLILGGLGGLYLAWPNEPENIDGAGTSPTVYPTLFSDKNITDNAIISDPKFRNTASLDKQESLASIFSLLLTKKGTLPETAEKEYGTWLWTPIPLITPEYRDSIILGAKEKGIKTIYLSIDSYLDVYTLPDGEEKEQKKKEFDSIVEGFLKEAYRHGLTVDAAGGWRNWAEPGHEYKAFAILNYAKTYNETNDIKFRGFQYDVEPYMLDYYKESKKEVLHRFVNLIHQSAKELVGSSLEFSVAIPEFYDGYKNETPKFFYALKRGYTIDHLIRVLEIKPGSKIIVMAYRNFAEGTDGAIHIAEDEMESAKGSSTRIIVAQEIGDVPPPYITFHNTSLKHYQEQLEIIENNLSGIKNFGGVSAHYINALLALE